MVVLPPLLRSFKFAPMPPPRNLIPSHNCFSSEASMTPGITRLGAQAPATLLGKQVKQDHPF